MIKLALWRLFTISLLKMRCLFERDAYSRAALVSDLGKTLIEYVVNNKESSYLDPKTKDKQNTLFIDLTNLVQFQAMSICQILINS